MNELQVECYDAKEVAAKRRSIKNRLAAIGGIIAISAGLFGSCEILAMGGAGSWYNCTTEPCECDPCPCEDCPNDE